MQINWTFVLTSRCTADRRAFIEFTLYLYIYTTYNNLIDAKTRHWMAFVAWRKRSKSIIYNCLIEVGRVFCSPRSASSACEWFAYTLALGPATRWGTEWSALIKSNVIGLSQSHSQLPLSNNKRGSDVIILANAKQIHPWLNFSWMNRKFACSR